MAAPREPSVSGTCCAAGRHQAQILHIGQTAISPPLPPLRGFFLLSNIALIAVTCRTGSAESTPRRAFLEPKNLMTSWPIKLSQATVKAIAKAKPNSRAARTIKNLPALGTWEKAPARGGRAGAKVGARRRDASLSDRQDVYQRSVRGAFFYAVAASRK
jgi:hypothetical protein